ncbi:MAG: hypothetical protein HY280_01500 [Nitrospinae bacterium]|nr:hypothetical protein [Nitrospinota bacterium]
MKNNAPSEHNKQKRTKIAVGILAVGFVSALGIYLKSAPSVENPMAEFQRTKKFTSELERLGGAYAVWSNDLINRFNGLWQGEHLAYTVLVITIFVAAIYYILANSRDERHDA